MEAARRGEVMEAAAAVRRERKKRDREKRQTAAVGFGCGGLRTVFRGWFAKCEQIYIRFPNIRYPNTITVLEKTYWMAG
jgi:hypothetical protein